MNTLLIAKRDLSAYLHGFSGYAVMAAILLVDGLLFNFVGLEGGPKRSHAVLEQFFELTSGCVMVVALLFAMPTLASERADGTDVLLRTSAVSDLSTVLGKYLGSLGMLTVFIALTAYMPALVMVNGKVSLSHIFVGYFGLWLLGSSVTSIGVFASSLFKSQLAAGVIGGVITVSFLLGWAGSQATDPPFTDILAYLAMWQEHFQPFQEGRIQSTSLVFHASVTFVFLTLATRVLQSRRHE